MGSPFLDGIGKAVGKIADWVPNKRESLQNKIDKIKQEMVNVQNKEPFDSVKYERLANELRNAESAEKRAS